MHDLEWRRGGSGLVARSLCMALTRDATKFSIRKRPEMGLLTGGELTSESALEGRCGQDTHESFDGLLQTAIGETFKLRQVMLWWSCWWRVAGREDKGCAERALTGPITLYHIGEWWNAYAVNACHMYYMDDGVRMTVIVVIGAGPRKWRLQYLLRSTVSLSCSLFPQNLFKCC